MSSGTTWNPNDKGANVTLSNGDLTASSTGVSGNGLIVRSTTGKTNGKWYWEITVGSTNPSRNLNGVLRSTTALASFLGAYPTSWSYYGDGRKFTNFSGTAYGSSYTAGDVIGIALDLDNGKIWFSKNGTWQNSGDPAAGTGEAFSGLSGTIHAGFSNDASGNTTNATANFGATAFAYSPPSGFTAGLTP